MFIIKVSIGSNPIPDCEVSYAGANLDDLAGNLMTNYARKLNGQPSCFNMLNGQPRATCEDTRDGFARSGNRIGDLIQLEWRVRPSENQCFHTSVRQSDPE